jgi:AraC-like DNA-binding protein
LVAVDNESVQFDSTITPARLIKSDGDGCPASRWVRRPEPGVLQLDQQIQVADRQRGLDVTGRFWMFAIVKVESGNVEYLSGHKRIRPPAPLYGIFAPPFSVIEVSLNQSSSHSMAIASANKLPSVFPAEPVVFDVKTPVCPTSIDDLVELIDAAPNLVSVNRCAQPSSLALRIKEAIDGSYMFPLSLSEIATNLRTSPATMSRYFKRAYGMPPVRYRHIIRTLDGMMRLLDGGRIENVFQEVGFDDLSRFYRHFKKHMLAPPSKYRF